MSSLFMRYAIADAGDVQYITSAQKMPHIRDYISEIGYDDIVNSITRPDEAFLIGTDVDENRVAYAYLRGIGSSNRCIELRQIAVTHTAGGVGRMFLELLMSEAFEQHNAHRFWLDVFPQNARARHVYQTCGFTEEGTLRDLYFVDGKFQSSIIMSILSDEYKALDK